MINIAQRTTPPLQKSTLGQLNRKITPPLGRDNLQQGLMNQSMGQTVPRPAQSVPQSAPRPAQSVPQSAPRSAQPAMSPLPPKQPVPAFARPLQRGQKITVIPDAAAAGKLKIRFGWNIKDARCDVDASAFLVDQSGKVPDESWFVFYGQDESADGSVRFIPEPGENCREVITADLAGLNPAIQKLVFVLTINEAFEKGLNFSMLSDAYIQVIDQQTGKELAGYCLTEYFENVTSMTMGELYLYKGQWKFNPVGSGVHQDLAGQCAIYGVEIEG